MPAPAGQLQRSQRGVGHLPNARKNQSSSASALNQVGIDNRRRRRSVPVTFVSLLQPIKFKVITWSNHGRSYSLVSSPSAPAREFYLVCQSEYGGPRCL